MKNLFVLFLMLLATCLSLNTIYAGDGDDTPGGIVNRSSVPIWVHRNGDGPEDGWRSLPPGRRTPPDWDWDFWWNPWSGELGKVSGFCFAIIDDHETDVDPNGHPMPELQNPLIYLIYPILPTDPEYNYPPNRPNLPPVVNGSPYAAISPTVLNHLDDDHLGDPPVPTNDIFNALYPPDPTLP